MHICYVLWKFKSPQSFIEMGGAERQLLNLLNEFKKREGLKVTVFAKKTENDLVFEEYFSNIKIIRIPVPPIKFISLFFFTLLLPFFIFQETRKCRIDIIHIPLSDVFLLSLLFVAKFCKIPLISRIAGDELEPFRKHGLWFINRIIVRKLVMLTDAIQVLTNYSYQQAINLGIEANKLFLIPNGVILPSDFRDYNHFSNNVVYIGAMRFYREKNRIEQKNLKFLIKAFKIALKQRKDLLLYMVGDGNYRQDLEKYVKQKGLEKNVIFTGYKTDIKQYLLKADIFVNPSHYEGLPNTVIESMSFGVLSMCSDIPEHRFIIMDGKTGILFDRFSEEALSSEIVNFYEKTDEKIKIAKQGRTYVENHFSIQDVTKKILKMYSKLKYN